MKGYRRLVRLLWPGERSRERETDEEIAAHLELRVADLVAGGMSEEEARSEALARFGDLEEARRRIRRAARRRDRRLDWLERLDGVHRDLLVAARRIGRRPGHAMLGVAIFGAGIGLTTVMFTFVDNVLLRPLPFPEPDRLVALFSVPEDGRAFPWVSMGNWHDWQRDNRTLESTAIHSQEPRDVTVRGEDGAFTAPGVSVYGAFFETLRLPMVVGRAPSAEEAASDPDMVVVSESFWRRILGGGATLEERTLELDGRTRHVVGVVARGYEHPEGVDLWLPQPHRAQTGAARNNINFLAVARLAEGTTVEQAEADLSSIADGIRASDPEAIYSWGVAVQPLHDVVIGDAGQYLGVLMGAVVLVLLIGCANLAALGFARGTERQDEVALRLSLGASRRRIVRQLLTEELLLAVAGGAVALALAWWGTGAVLDGVGHVIPRSRDVGFDGRVAAFGVLVALFAGVAAGLPPALRAAKGGPGQVLAGGRTIRSRGGLPGVLLVGGEVALTVLLLTGGGLLLMSLDALVSRDVGFDPRNVATIDVALTAPEYRGDNERVVAYWESLVDVTEALPAIEAVGVGNWIPTGGGGTGFIDIEGDPGEDGSGAGYRVVGGDYFGSLRIPVLVGRVFDERDRLDTELVTVINQAMADEHWPSSNPIGQRVRALSMESYWFGGEAPWRTVVGVVGDVRHYGFESDMQAEMFVPYRQMPWMSTAMSAVVRVRGPALAQTLPLLREEVQALDPSLAVDVATLEDRLHRTVSERRMIATMLTAFALAALMLASLGVYGVISYAVGRRTREMAIRSALGAQRAGLVRLVLVGAMRLVALGAAVGLLLAAMFRSVLDSLLVDVSSGDPAAYVASGACLLVVALTAALVPALRAARLDPLEALRSE